MLIVCTSISTESKRFSFKTKYVTGETCVLLQINLVNSALTKTMTTKYVVLDGFEKKD